MPCGKPLKSPSWRSKVPLPGVFKEASKREVRLPMSSGHALIFKGYGPGVGFFGLMAIGICPVSWKRSIELGKFNLTKVSVCHGVWAPCFGLVSWTVPWCPVGHLVLVPPWKAQRAVG